MEALESKDPLEILAWQYDIVCNGVELSSGAIRNHRPDIMYKAFEIAGYSREEVDTNFAGMINAFKFGAPPHGGSAPGIDRIVMLLADEPNIREVILFPMNQKAEDLMMNAPSEVTAKQLKELHIKVVAAELEAPQNGTKSSKRLRPSRLSASRGAASFCPRGEFSESSIRARPLPLCASIWRSFSCRRSRIGAARSSCSKGPRASGKKYALKQLAAAFDPCHCRGPFDRLRPARGIRRPLAGALLALPAGRRADTAIFYRSWYLRVLDDRMFRAHRRECGRARVRRDQRVRGAAARLRHVDREAVLRGRRRSSGAAAGAARGQSRGRTECAATSRSRTDDPGLSARVRSAQGQFRYALVAVADDRRQRRGAGRASPR